MSNGSDQHAGPLPIPEIADGRYETKRVLGAGSYGTVVLAADRENKGELVAIKYLECNGLRQPGNERLAHREIVNHSSLAHPHVIGFKRCILTEHHFGIVMEYASKGQLFEYVRESRRLSEDEARWFYKQLILAIDYCHKKNIVNRDIKLENTLLETNPRPNAKPLLKLCDFGLSVNQEHSRAKTLGVGTVGYLAPELHAAPELLNRGELQPGYDGRKADVFSSGVLLYTMLVGAYPFDDPSDQKYDQGTREIRVRKRAAKGSYAFPRQLRVTMEAKDLLQNLLCPDPDKRISVAEIEAHPWVKQGSPRLDLGFNENYLRIDSHPCMVKYRLRVQEEADDLLMRVFGNEDQVSQLEHAPDSMVNAHDSFIDRLIDHSGEPIEV